jgi:predicted nucleic acid-binding protein
MKPKVYIETTIVSYLTARRNRDLIVAAHQELTQEWWQRRRGEFELYCSQLVIHEASAGHKEAAQRRLQVLQVVSILEINDAAKELARHVARAASIPRKATEDALHIALATVHGMDYLLTWNCKHIANAEMQKSVSLMCHIQGYEPPVICTPEELMGD